MGPSTIIVSEGAGGAAAVPGVEPGGMKGGGTLPAPMGAPTAGTGCGEGQGQGCKSPWEG